MAGNKAVITFNQDLPVGGQLTLSGFVTALVGPPTSFGYTWDWVTVRNSGMKVTAGTPSATPGERTAINFLEAFNLDVNAGGSFITYRVGNVVTIISPYAGALFGARVWENGFAWQSLNPLVSANILFNFTYEENAPFQITDISFGQALANQCNNVRVTVKTNVNIRHLTSPQTILNVNNTEVSFDFPRSAAGLITVVDMSGQPASQSFPSPNLLAPANYIPNVFNSPNGATMVVNYNNQYLITPTFALALPNTTPAPGQYQADPVFGGLAPGDYWLYIKDQYGCIKYTTFTVGQSENRGPSYFYISKAMSLRFANRIEFGDASNYKTDENTLSCEADVKLPYKEIQQFQTADVITTQFKSNYTNNTATIVKSDGTEIPVPVLQKSNNLGVKDKRDAIKVNLGNGKTGIYFTSGNIYDYDTNADIGDYALNGALPYWATAGNYFNFENIWYPVEDTYFDETLNVDMLVVDMPYTGLPATVVVSSIYNVFSYEVYEFTIDFVDYQDQDIMVRIYCSDDTYGDITLLSELINVKVRQKQTVEIKYSNPTNTDVFYSTGITNLIRQQVTRRGAVPDEQSENYKTDTTTELLSSEVHEIVQYVFEPVTTEIMRKMIQAFNHKTLQLDGVYYVKNGNCEVNGPLEETNLYVITANFIKTGGAFNSNITGGGNELFDTTNTEIPGLIDLGTGTFLEY